jgi:cytochrome c-type biogenesis protein CcmH
VSEPILLLLVLLIVALLVTAYVLRPLIAGPARRDEPDAAAVALAVLRERRGELDAALAHLPPDSPERRAALAEFAMQAESELPSEHIASNPAAPAGSRQPRLAALIALALIVPTFGLYWLAGLPEAASPEVRAMREPASLEELIERVRTRLRDSPTDIEGWQMLGRAELARGNPQPAREAFDKALVLAPNNAQIKVDLADAIAQTQGAVLEGRPIALIREALASEPRNPKGLALAGAYEVRQGNTAAALANWKTLLTVLPPDTDQARQIVGLVADLEAGRTPQVGPAAAAAPTAPAAAETGSRQAAASGGAASADPGAGALSGRIQIDAALAGKLRPDDTLFVVARSLDAQGQPSGPPLAVLRARGADLPLAFTLDDRLAMGPMAKLSSVAPGTQVKVVARISRSGEAATRSGDLQGSSDPVKPGTSGMTIVISKEAP